MSRRKMLGVWVFMLIPFERHVSMAQKWVEVEVVRCGGGASTLGTMATVGGATIMAASKACPSAGSIGVIDFAWQLVRGIESDHFESDFRFSENLLKMY